MNHDIPSSRYLRGVKSQDFADAPANPIAYNRAAQGFFHADAETAASRFVWAEENNELRARTPAAATIHGFKFDAADEPSVTRKAPAPLPPGAGNFRRA
ncbi:MAG TPA: hypothetical protein VGZ48_09335 [Candidatus Acidoferrales bacterium]|nr:hypothetical protein [Candidatus Acidoferrales bacterium]